MRQENLPDVTPSIEDQLENWWLLARQRVQASSRKAFDARVMLTCWLLWKQRNVRVFAIFLSSARPGF
jgi:hypothetical protein